MLCRNILKHEEGHDYEFAYGEFVDITEIEVDEYGELNFRINGEIACATIEEFEESWEPIKVELFYDDTEVIDYYDSL